MQEVNNYIKVWQSLPGGAGEAGRAISNDLAILTFDDTNAKQTREVVSLAETIARGKDGARICAYRELATFPRVEVIGVFKENLNDVSESV